jgi:hypothetical protein
MGIPNQYLKAAENWLSSKYLKEFVEGAAESQRAAPSEETDLKRAFSRSGRSGFAVKALKMCASMLEQNLFCRGCWFRIAAWIELSSGKSIGN